MAKKSSFIFCLFILLFCACEKQRFLNVPFGDRHFVINGLFNTNESCKIEISESKYLNDTNDVNNVSGASVLLYEDELLLEELTYTPPGAGENLGAYESTFSNFKKAKKYSIEVSLGNQAITASDRIPDQQATLENVVGPASTNSSVQDLDFTMDINQSNVGEQYFHILLQHRWVFYVINSNDTILNPRPWFDANIYPEDNSTGFISTTSEPFRLIAGGKLSGIMLDNKNFSNQVKTINCSAKTPVLLQSNSFLESRMILRSVSANYFKYYFSSSQYFRTKSIPLTEPIIIYNNITNGLGNFSGFSSDTSAVITTFY
jgi:hypothetical protein